jgi:ribosomal-protein-alanine N-acetyltransferase
VGRRVVLRAPAASDQAEFLALNRASRRLHRGLVSPPTTPRQFARYLERSAEPNRASFFICRRTDGALLGVINLGHILRGPLQSAYVGYFVGAPYARRGYMTEALELMLRHAWRNLKLHRLEANIQPGNRASRALVKRAGFTREGYSPRYLKVGGRWRDHERWALLAEDWRAARRRQSSGDQLSSSARAAA